MPRLRVVPGGRADASPSDGALCRDFLSGDGEAFGELIRRHQDTVYRVVRRRARTPEDARDLTQKVFLQAFEAARRALIRTGAFLEVPFKAWLLRIAINAGKNHLRNARRWSAVAVDVNGALRAGSQGQSPQEALQRAQDEAFMREVVNQLPRRQREVFTLRIDGALPFAEVAAALGIAEDNAKSHFHHAVKRLKAEAQRREQTQREHTP